MSLNELMLLMFVKLADLLKLTSEMFWKHYIVYAL